VTIAHNRDIMSKSGRKGRQTTLTTSRKQIQNYSNIKYRSNIKRLIGRKAWIWLQIRDIWAAAAWQIECCLTSVAFDSRRSYI